MDSGVFSSSERAAREALAAAAAPTEGRRARRGPTSRRSRTTCETRCTRRRAGGVRRCPRAVGVARKHVEAAARSRAGAADYASSRAGGIVVNATAPPTLKGKARGFTEARAGPSMVISSRAVDAARCWGFAGDHGRSDHPGSSGRRSGILRGRTRAESAWRARRLEAAAPREFFVTGPRRTGVGERTTRASLLLRRRRRPAARRFPAQVRRGGRGPGAPPRGSRCVRREQPGAAATKLSLPGALVWTRRRGRAARLAGRAGDARLAFRNTVRSLCIFTTISSSGLGRAARSQHLRRPVASQHKKCR